MAQDDEDGTADVEVGVPPQYSEQLPDFVQPSEGMGTDESSGSLHPTLTPGDIGSSRIIGNRTDERSLDGVQDMDENIV